MAREHSDEAREAETMTIKTPSHVARKTGTGIVGGLVGGVIRAAWAGLAFWDLYIRPENKLNGKKPLWAFVIVLGGIGPLIYFFFAPKR
jgi:hypothetical protein